VATAKRLVIIFSTQQFVQNRIKNSFFCDLPIYRKPLDNVGCNAEQRYILLFKPNNSPQASEK
jgi:hypothetical protein